MTLTQQHRRVLADLDERGGSALWHQLAISHTVLNRLEEARLVTGSTQPAGYRVTLTEAGRKVARASADANSEEQSRESAV